MLIKDKYTPKYFKEYIINKNIIDTYKNLGKKPLYNTLINGTNGIGKYTIAKSILCEIFGKNVYNLKKNSINLKSKNNNKTINFYSSIYHIEIKLNKYSFNDKTSIIKLIKTLCNSLNIFNDYNIILIRNADNLIKHNFKILKNIIECYKNTRFILTSNNIYFMNEINSFFNIISLPNIKATDLHYLLKNISNKEQIKYNEIEINEIIENSDNNLKKSLLYFENSYIDGTYKSYKNPIFKEINKLIKQIEMKDINLFLEIRKQLYFLTSCNIEHNFILRKIIEYFNKSSKYSTNIKLDIIKSATNYNYNSIKSYRSLIHLESFIFNLINIIN